MSSLRVLEVFDSLQGEGYWTGAPMSFVRLAGCNAPDWGLGCVVWCDTRDSWDPSVGEEMEVSALLRQVRLPRLCLTGGEPLLQVDGCRELVAEAHRLGIRVHLETNGTLSPAGDFDWATVSPKPPDYYTAPEWTGRIDELKLVVDQDLDAATAERPAAAHPGAVVYLQPQWSDAAGYAESCRRAVSLVMDHPEWRLSLQVHKLLGIR